MENIIKNLVNDLDKSFREHGIGDMSIGKYVKSYVKKFYYILYKLDPLLDNFNEKEFTIYLQNLKIVKKEKISLLLSRFIIINDEIKSFIISNKNKLNH